MWIDVKTLEEAYLRCPDIKKITFNDLNKICYKIKRKKINIRKSFIEQGYDELDCIEIAIELEKLLNIQLTDEVVEFIFSPNSIPDFVLQSYREEKINEILKGLE